MRLNTFPFLLISCFVFSPVKCDIDFDDDITGIFKSVKEKMTVLQKENQELREENEIYLKRIKEIEGELKEIEIYIKRALKPVGAMGTDC
jgi:hypothetical protein